MKKQQKQKQPPVHLTPEDRKKFLHGYLAFRPDTSEYKTEEEKIAAYAIAFGIALELILDVSREQVLTTQNIPGVKLDYSKASPELANYVVLQKFLSLFSQQISDWHTDLMEVADELNIQHPTSSSSLDDDDDEG